MPEGLRHHQGIPSSTACMGSAYTRPPPHPLPNSTPAIVRVCAHPNFISSGYGCAKPMERGLGVSTFPWGRMADARENESPLTVYDPHLLNEAPGTPDPRTSKRHPEIGLHTPKDHQDHGTGFRLGFRAHLGLPNGS
ncbi:hypothetical protein CRG98_027803 [Punica granatum]|uniref:Uncharacterized protein n=1 Tax=Punica granatum TaxID=22663 RepID=A0A2I0J6Y9_PUNGR|nr:hypothetical protein CRG98_027803 [Punica granatum]